MKHKLLLLFLASTVLLGTITAHAQCAEVLLGFPSSGLALVQTDTCLAAPNQAGRLRWNHDSSGLLQLFDTDENKQQIWCAGEFTGGCVSGQSFCLRSDGNAIIFSGPNCTGTERWSSGTGGTNVCEEGFGVGDFTPGGEMVVIINHLDPNCGNHSQPVVVWSRGTD
jgi:hypothetical protein